MIQVHAFTVHIYTVAIALLLLLLLVLGVKISALEVVFGNSPSLSIRMNQQGRPTGQVRRLRRNRCGRRSTICRVSGFTKLRGNGFQRFNRNIVVVDKR